MDITYLTTNFIKKLFPVLMDKVKEFPPFPPSLLNMSKLRDEYISYLDRGEIFEHPLYFPPFTQPKIIETIREAKKEKDTNRLTFLFVVLNFFILNETKKIHSYAQLYEAILWLFKTLSKVELSKWFMNPGVTKDSDLPFLGRWLFSCSKDFLPGFDPTKTRQISRNIKTTSVGFIQDSESKLFYQRSKIIPIVENIIENLLFLASKEGANYLAGVILSPVVSAWITIGEPVATSLKKDVPTNNTQNQQNTDNQQKQAQNSTQNQQRQNQQSPGNQQNTQPQRKSYVNANQPNRTTQNQTRFDRQRRQQGQKQRKPFYQKNQPKKPKLSQRPNPSRYSPGRNRKKPRQKR